MTNLVFPPAPTHGQTFQASNGQVYRYVSPPGLWAAVSGTSNLAGGDLTGTYPDPTIKTDVHLNGAPTTDTPPAGDTTTKIPTTAWVQNEIALDIAAIPPPELTGAAGGDLTGTYPSPTIKSSVALTGSPTTTTQTTGTNNTTVATTAYVKANIALVPAIPGSLPPSGPAAGDLAGTYPNPTIKASVGLTGSPTTTTPPASDATTRIPTTAWVQSEIAADIADLPVLPTSLPPSGAATGDLAGTYPAPTIKASVNLTSSPTTTTQPTVTNNTTIATTAYVKANIAALPSSMPPSGTASGDLAGTYPSPTIKASVGLTGTPTTTTPPGGDNTTKIPTTAWVRAELPTSLPPSGTASGDLSGSYPGPSIKASVDLTGAPTSPTPPVDDSSTRIATTEYVQGELVGVQAGVDAALLNYLPLAGGTLTGQLNSTTALTGVSEPAINVQQTWNNAATTFSAFELNVTDTASNTNSLLAAFRVGGASRVTILKSGTISSTGSVAVSSTGLHYWSTRSIMSSPADGQIRLTNQAQTDFSRLQFGGTTNTFPAIKRNLTALNLRTADDTADIDVTFKTQTAGTNNTTGATTAFVNTAVASVIGGATPSGPAGGDLSGTYPNPLLKPSVTNGQVMTTVGGVSTWATPSVGGTVTSTSVVSANGLAGTVATPSTTPAITLSTTVNGVVKGDGTALSAATPGTDYLVPGNVVGVYQPIDSGLTALSSIGTGMVTNTAADTFVGRTITGTASRLSVTNGSGVAGNPTLNIDTGYVGQTSLTTLGTITAGTWNGSLIAGQYGGTGVANTGKTITIGGNLTTAGAFASTFTMTGITTVTFPTTGTLATTAQIPTSLPPNGAAAGDLAGTYPAPTLKASIALTGVPTTTTPAAADNTSQIPTTAWVQSEIASDIAALPPAPTALPPNGPAGGDLAGTYPAPTVKSSVALAGSPTTTTQATATNNTTVATTAYVKANIAALPAAPTTLPPNGPASGDLAGTYPSPTIKASVALTGTPTTTAPPAADSTLKIPTTAWVQSEIAADIAALPSIPPALPPNGPASGDLAGTYPGPTVKASVNLSGVPTAATAAPATSTTQLATTAFVTSALGTGSAAERDIYTYGATGAGGATDLTALDSMLLAQQTYLPRLYIWDKTSIDVGTLIPGSDVVDPMTSIQKIFAAFDTPGMQGKHFIFGRNRAWKFLTRPSTGLGPQNQYLTPPQRCTLEWQREWDFTSYTPSTAPTFVARAGDYGTAKTTVGDLVKGQRTITVGAGQAVGLKYGDRLLLHSTTQQTTLVGAFTLVDNNPVHIIASISGTTMTVTDVTAVPPSTLNATLTVGTEIVEAGVTVNTVITAFGTGTGGLGTYTVNNSQTVSSRTMFTSSGHGARAEDLIVKSVAGDVITFEGYLQDDYPALAKPVLKQYLNEPEIRLVNPTVMGPGWNGTQSDRLFRFRRGRNHIVEGGRLDGFAQPIGMDGMLGGRCSDLQVFGIAEAIPGGGFNIIDGISNYLFENCSTWGGSQMFMLTSQGDAWGVARDITFTNCVVNGSQNGFSTHNTHERIRYNNCQVNNSVGSAFDIRVRGVTMTNCTVRNSNAALLIRPPANDFVCDGLRVDKALSGILYDDAASAEGTDYNPSNITIRNCLLERIGGSGSNGAIKFDFPNNVAGVFPVLGPLNIIGNTITMTDNTRPIAIRGKWTSPVVEGNTITGADGFHPTGSPTVIEIVAPTGGVAGDGPSNPVVRRNTFSSDYSRVFLQNTSGVAIIDPQEMPGVTTTSITALTTNTTLLDTQMGQIFTNEGTTGAVTVTLPPVWNVNSIRFEFHVTTAQALNIVSSNAMQIRLSSTSVGTNLKSSTPGAWARLVQLSSTLYSAEVDDPANWTQDWTPHMLGSDLIAWWDIAKPPTNTGTFRWNDIVSNHLVSQATAGLQPTWDATAVDFTGNKWASATTYPPNMPIGSTPGCLWAAVNQTNLAADATQRWIFTYGTANTTSRAIARTVNTGENHGFAQLGDGASKTPINSAVDFSGHHWVAGIYTGTGIFCRVDGISSATTATGTVATSTGRLRIGADYVTTPSALANMPIKRVLVTNLLSAENQALLEAWLGGVVSTIPVSTGAARTPEYYGAIGDGVADDTTALNTAISAAIVGKWALVLKSGAIYRTTSLLSFDITGTSIDMATDGAERAIIRCDSTTAGSALTFSATAAKTFTTLAANQRMNSSAIVVTSATGADPGDMVRIKSNKAWYYEPREASGITHWTGTARAGTANTITLAAAADATTAYVGKAITVVGGTGVKQARNITAYDTGTKVATVHRNWSTNPDTTSLYMVPQAFKGENHVITKVTGTTIELRMPVFDGYDITTADGIGLAYEDVVIEIATPGRAVIDNVTIERAQNGPGSSDYCLSLIYLVDSHITNCLFDKGRDQGLSIRECVDTKVDNCGFRGMNNATSTGYGASAFNSTGTYFFRCWGYNNRRVIDVSGMETPSRATTIDSCTATGGGMSTTGNMFGPAASGTVEGSFGFGSHAAADHTRYINNRISNLTYGIIMRGSNEHIENNAFYGYVETCIYHACGAEVVIKNNTYVAGWRVGYTSDALATTHMREIKGFQGVGPGNYTCKYFFMRIAPASVTNDWVGPSDGATLIAGNVVKYVTNSFIVWSSSALSYAWPYLTVRDNQIFIDPTSAATEGNMIGRTSLGALLTLDKATLHNNFLWDDTGPDTVYMLGTDVALEGIAAPASASQLGTVNTYRMYLQDDTAGWVRSPQRMSSNHMRIEVTVTNSTGFMLNGYLATTSGTLISAGALVGVEGSTVALTGVTGTDGVITIAYVANKLYVENRTGSTRNIVLRLYPMD